VSTVLKYVKHTIRHVDEGGWILEAFCAKGGCEDTSGPKDSSEDVELWCMSHTGFNPDHDLFRRVASDHARVTREE
jgi:hypothetical protein